MVVELDRSDDFQILDQASLMVEQAIFRIFIQERRLLLRCSCFSCSGELAKLRQWKSAMIYKPTHTWKDGNIDILAKAALDYSSMP